MNIENKELIGHISVDAGLCFIGDPSYQSIKSNFADWGKFCGFLNKNDHDARGYTNIKHSETIAGKGIVVSTGYGDGLYPVYMVVEDGRPMKIVVDFANEED